MNTTNFSLPGGMPSTVQDFDHAFQGVYEALKAICKGFSDAQDAILLEGAEITLGGGLVEWTEGWIYFSGELYHVPAQTPISHNPLGDYFWAVDVSVPVNGTKSFEDGQTHDVRFIRSMSYREISAGDQYLDPDNLRSIDRIKAERLLFDEDQWETVTPNSAGQWSQQSGNALMVKAGNYGRVEFRGGLTHPNTGGGNPFTLPVDYRPARKVYLTPAMTASNNPTYLTNALVSIGTDGVVTWINPSIAGTVNLWFDGVSYRPK